MGDIGLLGIPGEVLVAHGLEFKRESGVDMLMPAGYAGGYVVYMSTLSDLEQVGYEVRTMKISPETIVEFREGTLGLVSRKLQGRQHVGR